MKHNVENLQDLYVENYLQPIKPPVAPVVTESDDIDFEVIEEAKKGKKKFKKFEKKGKGKKSMSDEDKGGICYDSVNFNSHFDRLLKEFDEGGDMGDDSFGGEDDSEYSFDDEGGDDEQISVSKSVLQSIMDQLSDLIGDTEDEFTDEGGDDFGDEDDGEIPLESYAFSGDGKEKGAKGNYDGKAKLQGKSRHIKDNGDANFSDQDTGYDPEDTEGSEGSEHGDQGDYDGKAKVQGKSSHVGDNGNAKVGKSQNTGYRTGTGKGNNKF